MTLSSSQGTQIHRMMLPKVRMGFKSAMLVVLEAALQLESRTVGLHLLTFNRKQDRGQETRSRLIMAKQARRESQLSISPSLKFH